MTRLQPRDAYYIKLGTKGEWEKHCLKEGHEGTLRLGYHEVPHGKCTSGDSILAACNEVYSDKPTGVAARHAPQIRSFYEAGEDSVFITFHGGAMWWCQPTGEVRPVEGTDYRERSTLKGWSNRSLKGDHLASEFLSGGLTAKSMFRGTICEVRNEPKKGQFLFDYLVRKINGERSGAGELALQAEKDMLRACKEMIGELTPRDFELLVDLVFSASGWRRISEVGGPKKTVDMYLEMVVPGDKALVQVKSETTQTELRDYLPRFKEEQVAGDCSRFFFVHHSPHEIFSEPDVDVIGTEKLARLVLATGMWSWLLNKTS